LTKRLTWIYKVNLVDKLQNIKLKQFTFFYNDVSGDKLTCFDRSKCWCPGFNWEDEVMCDVLFYFELLLYILRY